MKKKDLTTAGIYLVIGVICFAALVLTDSKLDSLLIAGAALICGALKLIDILAFGDKLMYALAAWVILQLILVDVIYRCLNRKYSD